MTRKPITTIIAVIFFIISAQPCFALRPQAAVSSKDKVMLAGGSKSASDTFVPEPAYKNPYPVADFDDISLFTQKLIRERGKGLTVVAVQADEEGRASIDLAREEFAAGFRFIDKVIYTDDIDEAAGLVARGEADLLMKGEHVGTDDIFKPLKNRGLLYSKRVAVITVARIPVEDRQRMILFTDPAFTLQPKKQDLIEITKNAIYLARILGFDRGEKPLKVAILSASEKPKPGLENSLESVEISRMDWPCVVKGPVSLDIALQPEAARLKNYKEIEGDADILIVPCITTGNVLHKTLTICAGVNKLADVTFGMPAITTSRSDTRFRKYYSIILSVMLEIVRRQSMVPKGAVHPTKIKAITEKAIAGAA